MKPHLSAISQMEPMLPAKHLGLLHEKAADLLRKTSRLSGIVQPPTARALTDLLRAMNSYYSNLIEGQSTHPISIERALNKQFEGEPRKRNLQKLALAHIQVQKEIERKIASEPEINVSGRDFLKWVHREFYKNLPDEFLLMKHDGEEEIKIEAGELRRREVKVGTHVPPPASQLDSFLKRFEDVYDYNKLAPLDRIIAASAAHHRLAWIHPFMDGNGRVMRLYTDAFFHQAKMGGFGLWTISRGLARKRSRYYEFLSVADEGRKGDYDGRGALSDDSLSRFCSYFIDVAIDQVDFMASVLELDQIERRLESFFQILHDRKLMRSEAFFLLREVFLRGEVPRGEASRIMGLAESTAREAVRRLVMIGLLQSDTPKAPLKIRFTLNFAAYLFPSLYPEGLGTDFRDFENLLSAKEKRGRNHEPGGSEAE